MRLPFSDVFRRLERPPMADKANCNVLDRLRWEQTLFGARSTSLVARLGWEWQKFACSVVDFDVDCWSAQRTLPPLPASGATAQPAASDTHSFIHLVSPSRADITFAERVPHRKWTFNMLCSSRSELTVVVQLVDERENRMNEEKRS